MAETAASDIAAILADYIPRADYEATLEALNDTIADRDKHKADAEKHTGRLTELEKKLRGKSAREAYEKAAEKLKVDPKFKDGVFRLADIPADTDEPDPSSIEKHLAAFLKENTQYVTPEQTKPKTIPAGEGSGRGTSVRPGEPELRVTRKDIGNAVWMRDNQSRVHAATKAGLLVIDDN